MKQLSLFSFTIRSSGCSTGPNSQKSFTSSEWPPRNWNNKLDFLVCPHYDKNYSLTLTNLAVHCLLADLCCAAIHQGLALKGRVSTHYEITLINSHKYCFLSPILRLSTTQNMLKLTCTLIELVLFIFSLFILTHRSLIAQCSLCNSYCTCQWKNLQQLLATQPGFATGLNSLKLNVSSTKPTIFYIKKARLCSAFLIISNLY